MANVRAVHPPPGVGNPIRDAFKGYADEIAGQVSLALEGVETPTGVALALTGLPIRAVTPDEDPNDGSPWTFVIPVEDIEAATERIDERHSKRLLRELERADVVTTAYTEGVLESTKTITRELVKSAREIPALMVDTVLKAAAEAKEARQEPSLGLETEFDWDTLEAIERAADTIATRLGLFAGLAARDIYGEGTALRQTEVGIIDFIWKTVRDDRVREEHELLEGSIFSWASGGDPSEGFPGEPYGCRCAAEGIPPAGILKGTEGDAGLPEFLMTQRYKVVDEDKRKDAIKLFRARSPILTDERGDTMVRMVRDETRRVHRRVSLQDVEVRKKNGKTGIRGYAIKWGVIADIGWFTESFEKGAFDGQLDDTFYLALHRSLPIARSPLTMSLVQDDTGLLVDIPELDMDNPTAREVLSGVKRGDLDAQSIAFTPSYKREDMTATEAPDGGIHFVYHQVERLWEVSAVTFPAHESTTLEPRVKDVDVDADKLKCRLKRAEANFRSLPDLPV